MYETCDIDLWATHGKTIFGHCKNTKALGQTRQKKYVLHFKPNIQEAEPDQASKGRKQSLIV